MPRKETVIGRAELVPRRGRDGHPSSVLRASDRDDAHAACAAELKAALAALE
jgi:hypothetical protein